MSLLIPKFLFVSLIVLLSSIVLGFSEAEASYQVYKIKVVNEFPHDPKAYTQGLLYAENDTLFESTGLYGRSTVRKVALRNGKVEAVHEMQSSDFGEGLTLIGERLFQLTWLQDTGFIYDRYNLSKFEKFTHHMQDGWGLATDGGVLFGSDGTSTLYEIDPQAMKVIRKQVVKSQGHEVPYLNELEYVKNEVWANVYVTDCIARISPKDGTVIGWILLQSLREDLISRGYKDFEVLNGIAWDRDGDRIFVTGKLWPKLFEIKLLPLPPNAPLIGEINNLCIPKPFFLGKLES
ncbi:PREDICTED: glutaminyl-peptide cyclotransferase-like [Nicotiana attenuata]|uniref:Glutaminyl-peptide cyclotransferase n=1 Tax=Nicotiana attenuata TaxID=49451 RepID=A0A1J6IWQ0_NICAT|nr:PREDICTED: glutaminyl-peptide cyclotransferase-like [Nicotiana attenuata]OIT03219.1 glutaminyl-peptide cyclotransferase [Nicotiana attenuata]